MLALAASLDAVAILDAIAAVEAGGEYWRTGKAGERGRRQFLCSTWVRYTNADFGLWASRDTELMRRVERAHLSYPAEGRVGRVVRRQC